GNPGAGGGTPAARGAVRARGRGPGRGCRGGGAGFVIDLVALACDLVDVPSVSGEEAQVARFIGSYLTDLGYRVELFDAAPGRPNVLATTDRPPRIVLSSHLDTRSEERRVGKECRSRR